MRPARVISSRPPRFGAVVPSQLLFQRKILSRTAPTGASGGQGSPSTPAPSPAPAAPALPIVSSLPCALTNLSKVLQQPAAGGAASAAGATPGSGNLLSELLSPVNSLSPVLACDATLARVATTIKALSSQKPAVPPPAQAGPTAPAPQGIDLFTLLQQLLGLTPSAPSPH